MAWRRPSMRHARGLHAGQETAKRLLAPGWLAVWSGLRVGHEDVTSAWARRRAGVRQLTPALPPLYPRFTPSPRPTRACTHVIVACRAPYIHRTFAVLFALAVPAVEAPTPVQTGRFRTFLDACPPRRFPPTPPRTSRHARTFTCAVEGGRQRFLHFVFSASTCCTEVRSNDSCILCSPQAHVALKCGPWHHTIKGTRRAARY